MALNLDARQRAMLEAMGITVWLPDPVEPAAVAAVTAVAAAPLPVAEPLPVTAPVVRMAPPAPVSPPVAQAAAPAAEAAPAPVQPPAQTASPPPQNLSGHRAHEPRQFVQQPAAGPAGEPGLGWTISPAQLVYPHAPQHVHSAEQGGWLILLEPAANPPLLSPAQRPAADSAQTALQGDAAKLLDNMLRALGLQEKPRVFSAALHRAPPDADLSHAQALQPALEALLRELRPDCVLVLGLASARAVLGRHDALGRLRAEPHHIAGVPTVVTYDPNYLLRAPQAKAGAWADLVQADAFTKGL
ncbi:MULTISPECIES: uracil-DNA glycosylase family protein [Comamonas]|uniref:DNA polymerase n=1 Tax=Comamonas thiooxydans TaxID=363952 RepID=A0A0E3BX64_9BURK|nr:MULTISPECIES: uracil-DNA glycosylase family protein [Comamonas]KGH08024.1 DNA polymerase [Comamonas thiooxydans]KGH16553.1 DNA polymerase [Comamonas thiooxydans]KGH20877.1 DNA polymerase [Comamonas thiooxydans]GAO69457.1 DNA polymerase [Comamonas sp. E6]